MVGDLRSGKLAVILHSDIAGSSGLVQQDERLAHERIQETFHRFSDTITQYHGRVRELRGDALLAEFERVSDAVTATLAFQDEQAKYNAQLNDNIQPTVRVGIAMGEVIIADNTVTGSGVVLAQRVEQLAEPGGVCITAAIHEAIPQRMPFDQENLGEQQVKGFDEPVRVYRVKLSPGESIPSPQESYQRETRPKYRRLVIAVAAALVIVGGTTYWFNHWEPREEPASVENMAFPLPDKPSIAVLPFTNMSGDAEQEYFVDGMTEDLITDLSNLSGLFVIARNSVFTYKGKPVKVKQVAEELGVRYVMEGSVRRVGNQVRINAQLIDATTGGHLWAERYDGSMENVFALQDGVTQRIVAALAVELTGEEVAQRDRKDAVNTAAYDAFLQGWAYYKLGRQEDLARAKPFFEEAIRLDPGYAQAHAALAGVYWDAYINDWALELGIFSIEVESEWQEHLELAMKVPNSLAYILQSRVLASSGRYEEAAEQAEKAVALEGNEASALAGLANALVLVGRPEEGLKFIQEAMRLDPHHPPSYLIILGAAEFGMERYDEAVTIFKRAANRNPDNDMPLIYLASSYGHLGRMLEAEDTIEAANDLRARLGMGDLSLEKVQGNFSPFRGEINFPDYGNKSAQARLREGLSEIPALTWQYLIKWGPGSDRWEVERSTEIDIATAKSLHDKGVIFVDMSPRDMWKQEHIPGAVNLQARRAHGFSEEYHLRQTTLQAVVGKAEQVVFYRCATTYCGRGEGFSAKAVNWGYEKVYYLVGGTRTWKEAGYPVDKGK